MLGVCRLFKVGALHWGRVVHGGQGWRLVSAIWLHAGLIHLIVNLLSIIFVGIRLEQQFGFRTSSAYSFMLNFVSYISILFFVILFRLTDSPRQ